MSEIKFLSFIFFIYFFFLLSSRTSADSQRSYGENIVGKININISDKKNLNYKLSVQNLIEAINYLERSKSARQVISCLLNENVTFYIGNSLQNKYLNEQYQNKMTVGKIYWSPVNALKFKNGTMSPAMGLIHEMSHACHYIKNPLTAQMMANTRLKSKRLRDYKNLEEWYVIENTENIVSKDLGEDTRHSHYGKTYTVFSPTSR